MEGGGGRLRASNFQPLFHVEPAAGGSVDDPLTCGESLS
jgi:hypothetical protein